jgi:hypothetical protein
MGVARIDITANGGLINTDDVEVSRRSDVIVRPS